MFFELFATVGLVIYEFLINRFFDHTDDLKVLVNEPVRFFTCYVTIIGGQEIF